MKLTANQILRDLDLVIGEAKKADVLKAYRLANDEGKIQAGDMLNLTNDPTRHTTTTDLTSALIMLGCDFKGVAEWRARGNRAA